jgi:FlaA1/EpsC-like NDP-sugar epimerase
MAHCAMRNRHLFLLDVVLLTVMPIGLLSLRLESAVFPPGMQQALIVYVCLAVPTRIATAYAFGVYRSLWRYASLTELEHLVQSGALAGVLTFLQGSLFLVISGLAPHRLPYGFLVNDAVFAMCALAGSRLGLRLTVFRTASRKGTAKRLLIAGAGELGQSILRDLRTSNVDLLPIGFVDDDRTKRGQLMGGVPVLGVIDDIQSIVKTHHIDEIVIAIGSVRGPVVRKIVQATAGTTVETRIVPALRELLTGAVGVQALRRVEIEDLLGREAVKTDLESVRALVFGKTVLVTGAGGSIGSELCRQLAALNPSRLVVLDHSENQVFEIHSELRLAFKKLDIAPVIADLRYANRVAEVCERFRPQVIFHAAAHKHVPLMEANLVEAVSNNVLGTHNIVDAAVDSGCPTFVLISTDKAVRPTSVMGCTKRVAERIVSHAAVETGLNYVSVRFGNVLGSRGSVIPTFMNQIRAGGPVLVTHPEMRRFFMTIPEASQLVLQAAALGSSGDLFVLDMGEPVKIVDLARDLIRLSGLEEGVDIDIAYCGVRPGEKLYEELFFGHEAVIPTEHPKILRSPADAAGEAVADQIESLIRMTMLTPINTASIRQALLALVPDFHVPAPPSPLPVQLHRNSGENRARISK